MVMKYSVKKSRLVFNNNLIVKEYTKYTNKYGLWLSEEIVYKKHINISDKILDVGCGTGRTTIGLFNIGYRDIIGID